MVKVVQYKVQFRSRTYVPGETITGLSQKDETRLVGKGYCEYTESRPGERKGNPGIITGLNVRDASKVVESVETVEQLQQLLGEEKAGKNRTTLIELIQLKINQLDGTEENDATNDDEKTEDTGENPEDIDVVFDANDVVVD